MSKLGALEGDVVQMFRNIEIQIQNHHIKIVKNVNIQRSFERKREIKVLVHILL